MLTSGTTPSAPGGGLATPVAIAIKVKIRGIITKDVNGDNFFHDYIHKDDNHTIS